jgi:hypothetical protein
MNVKELIEKLKEFPDDMEVVVASKDEIPSYGANVEPVEFVFEKYTQDYIGDDLDVIISEGQIPNLDEDLTIIGKKVILSSYEFELIEKLRAQK